MTKYIRKPSMYVDRESDWIWLGSHEQQRDSVTVYEDDKQTFSGLYDTDGTPLYRDNHRPIGFLRD